MKANYADERYLWVLAYELAISERNSENRQLLLIKATKVLLERAWELQQWGGSDEECVALEKAADVIGKMKHNNFASAHF